MLLEYDGTGFNGWQVQPAHATVQQALEDALEVLVRYRPGITGSGRTDAGVHARGQVAHFDLDEPVDTHRMRRSLNGLLPRAIGVRFLEETHPEFHARYDAMSRRYHYYLDINAAVLEASHRVCVRPVPDFERMNEAAALIIGTHDFNAFCRVQSETTNRVCTVTHARFEPERKGFSLLRAESWRFEIVADRFLHGMVRAIVGTLFQIGHHKLDVDDLRSVIASKDRRQAGPAAPARGLVLEHVRYPDEFGDRT
jgi:tRNA pseudouridine38-40 synthase